jgi:hypothetical protein
VPNWLVLKDFEAEKERLLAQIRQTVATPENAEFRLNLARGL